MQDIVVKYLK